MIELFFLFLVLLAALSLGNRVLPLFKINFACFMEEQIAAAGLGFTGLILGVYILSAGHILSKLSINLLLVFSFLVGWTTFLGALRRAKTGIKPGEIRFSKWQKACIAILFAMFLFNLIGALSPTTDTDGLAYHLAVPQYYLDHGGFGYKPLAVFNWPLTIEMLYTIGISVSSDSLAKLLHLALGLLSALCVYLIGKEWFGRDAGIWAAILFYGMPLVGLESGIAYVDLGTTFFTVIGTLYFLRWYLESDDKSIGRRNELLLGAVFIGVGASSKWNGPITIIILAMFCAWKMVLGWFNGVSKPGSPQGRGYIVVTLFQSILLFLIIASAFTFLWYAKNLALTGNPVAPFLGNVIPTRDWGAVNTAAYQASVSSLYLSPLNFAFIPWTLFMHGQLFGELTFLGPWMLMLFPLSLLLFPWPRAASFIVVSSVIYYLFWFLTSQQSRLLLPTFALICAVCGWVMTHASFKHLEKVFVGLVFVSLILAMPFTGIYNGKGVKAAISLQTRGDYLEQVLPDARTLRYANEELPDSSKILLVRENNAYLLHHDYLWGAQGMQAMIDFNALSPQALYFRIKELGYTHIIVNRAITCADPKDEERHCPDIKGLLNDEETKEKIVPVFEANKVTLYKVV